ncbi:hypothetical protein AVEN_84949-1 [Araneus ventricosus]|uniref:Uncharacterized protein n=1 Tax=Araneus ventricosus TaxID=182803 RepID=A0A4Y2C0G7_ARAVE|nr:hypothetical protein AVEN_84949-1 [Araneus ventricosus]
MQLAQINFMHEATNGNVSASRKMHRERFTNTTVRYSNVFSQSCAKRNPCVLVSMIWSGEDAAECLQWKNLHISRQSYYKHESRYCEPRPPDLTCMDLLLLRAN